MKPSLQSLVTKWAKALHTSHARERNYSDFRDASTCHCGRLLSTFRRVKSIGRTVAPTEAECIAWMEKAEIEYVKHPHCAKVWGEVGVSLWNHA